MTTTDNSNDLYEVILIESDDDFAVIGPGIPGAISQRKDREEALKRSWSRNARKRAWSITFAR